MMEFLVVLLPYLQWIVVAFLLLMVGGLSRKVEKLEGEKFVVDRLLQRSDVLMERFQKIEKEYKKLTALIMGNKNE